MNKLSIFIILLIFSCNLSNSDQNNQLSISNKEKIVKYLANGSQTDIQFSNEIQALKDTRTITSANSPNSPFNYPTYIQTILKIEKQIDGKININEVTKKNGKETKKLLEIQKENISQLKDAIQYGGSFKAKDIRENQPNKEQEFSIYISNYIEYVHLQMPIIIQSTDSSIYHNNYIIDGNNLLRIISNL
ncbi:hypothetical protein [Borreliella lanei]|uniref:Lipoprotein n=1 Tax=Borreliella lanei TaxID=373540 RepID=A0A7X0DLT1_9SPIR|nr:hypothetical protein [Borreliella lanei]MBB6208502.1 hypothetical protein [Borreliella lanei]